MRIKKVLITSKSIAAALPYVKEAAAFLSSHNVKTFCPPEKAKFFDGIEEIVPFKGSYATLDAAIAFGGDGTILKAARLLLGSDAPILGVNMGTVGYLTDVEPVDTLSAVKQLLSGDFKTEKRSALRITSCGKTFVGVNEAVIYRGSLSHILTLNVKINGQNVETLRADGIIISTPTGSTAYNLSAGGPIVEPLSKTFVVTPICAHSLTARPLVIGDESEIVLTVSNFRSEREKPSLDVDGKTVMRLDENATVELKLAREKIVLARTKPTNFYLAIQKKLSAAGIIE